MKKQVITLSFLISLSLAASEKEPLTNQNSQQDKAKNNTLSKSYSFDKYKKKEEENKRTLTAAVNLAQFGLCRHPSPSTQKKKK